MNSQGDRLDFKTVYSRLWCVLGRLDFLEDWMSLCESKYQFVNSQESASFHPHGDRKQAKAAKAKAFIRSSSERSKSRKQLGSNDLRKSIRPSSKSSSRKGCEGSSPSSGTCCYKRTCDDYSRVLLFFCEAHFSGKSVA